MKTAEKNATAVQGTAAKNNEAVNRTTNRPSLTQKEAKEDENAKDQTPAQTPKVEAVEIAEVTTSHAPAMDNKSAHIDEPQKPEVKEEPKSEAPKAEAPPVKFVLNLEGTLKVVEDLHRRSIQRVNLITRINQLTAFEVALMQENDELEDNPYQGCKLIIKDDKNREFITTTPGLIRLVSQYISDACHEKLADIEANIVFPNA
ncbi:hypothetical protein BH09BAC6_BH09BAC6_24960 [soil metagenome]